GDAGRLDRGQRRGTGAAVVTGDQDAIGVGLGDARCDRADADLGDELDRHLGLGVGATQVVDQLLEILDRVDVVVGRRGDQAHAGGGMTDRADVSVDLVPWQLAALTRLGALGHLDLQLIRVDEVVDRHAEASRGDLLDRRAAAVAVGVGLEASRILPTLARVGAPTETVHGDRERLVGLARYGAEAHRAGAEAAHDLLRGLYLGERNRVSPDLPFGGSIVPAGAGARAALGPDPQEPAQGRLARRVLVDGCRVLAVLLESGRVAHLRVRGFIAPERSGDI